nr:hypothetical protein [Tanacetum cinerariifolium]
SWSLQLWRDFGRGRCFGSAQRRCFPLAGDGRSGVFHCDCAVQGGAAFAALRRRSGRSGVCDSSWRGAVPRPDVLHGVPHR